MSQWRVSTSRGERILRTCLVFRHVLRQIESEHWEIRSLLTGRNPSQSTDLHLRGCRHIHNHNLVLLAGLPQWANVWTIKKNQSKSIDDLKSVIYNQKHLRYYYHLGVRHLCYGISWLSYPIHYYKYLLKNTHFKHLPVFWSVRSFLMESKDAWVTANRKHTNPVQMVLAWDRENACTGGDLITFFVS